MVFVCDHILEIPGIQEYLEKKQLIKQYTKAKTHVLMGNFKTVDFRKRQPKEDNLYYFKINDQYRAIGYMDGKTFKVVEIHDHQ